jgi:hypothetical protein
LTSRRGRKVINAHQTQNLVEQPVSCDVAGDNRLEDVRVADLSCPPRI